MLLIIDGALSTVEKIKIVDISLLHHAIDNLPQADLLPKLHKDLIATTCLASLVILLIDILLAANGRREADLTSHRCDTLDEFSQNRCRRLHFRERSRQNLACSVEHLIRDAEILVDLCHVPAYVVSLAI